MATPVGSLTAPPTWVGIHPAGADARRRAHSEGRARRMARPRVGQGSTTVDVRSVERVQDRLAGGW